MDIKHTKNKYPTQIELCEGKYTIIYDFETGQSECLRYNEPWRKLIGDKMVLACFDEIVLLRQQRDELLAALHAAKSLIKDSPHCDNCFVSNHYEGDKGNQCNCGKESVFDFVELTINKVEESL